MNVICKVRNCLDVAFIYLFCNAEHFQEDLI